MRCPPVPAAVPAPLTVAAVREGGILAIRCGSSTAMVGVHLLQGGGAHRSGAISAEGRKGLIQSGTHALEKRAMPCCAECADTHTFCQLPTGQANKVFASNLPPVHDGHLDHARGVGDDAEAAGQEGRRAASGVVDNNASAVWLTAMPRWARSQDQICWTHNAQRRRRTSR